AALSHLIEDVACEDGLSRLPCWTAPSQAMPDDRVVPEEGVLHAGLPMVAGFLLPPSPTDLHQLLDRAIASARPRPPSRRPGRLGGWHHDPRATRTRGIIEGYRVVGRIPRDADDAALNCLNQLDGCRRVIDSGLGQRVRDDDTRAVDTQMELLPASLAVSSVFRSSPLPFAQDREHRAVDDEMHAFACRDSIKREVEVLAAPGKCRVIRSGEVYAHHLEERLHEPLGLTEWQVEEKTQRQRGL